MSYSYWNRIHKYCNRGFGIMIPHIKFPDKFHRLKFTSRDGEYCIFMNHAKCLELIRSQDEHYHQTYDIPICVDIDPWPGTNAKVNISEKYFCLTATGHGRFPLMNELQSPPIDRNFYAKIVQRKLRCVNEYIPEAEYNADAIKCSDEHIDQALATANERIRRNNASRERLLIDWQKQSDKCFVDVGLNNWRVPLREFWGEYYDDRYAAGLPWNCVRLLWIANRDANSAFSIVDSHIIKKIIIAWMFHDNISLDSSYGISVLQNCYKHK